MNKKALIQFLLDSNQAGYAGGEEKKWIKEPDGSTTISYIKGKWRSHDNFFGGEPYGGRIVVFQDEKPVWMMVYYGWVVEGIGVNPIYAVLKGALLQMPKEAPFRGPKEFKDGKFVYRNKWDGNVERYFGKEKITQDNTLIYEAHYRGGLVDQRKEE
jgi:hypothetical protein